MMLDVVVVVDGCTVVQVLLDELLSWGCKRGLHYWVESVGSVYESGY